MPRLHLSMVFISPLILWSLAASAIPEQESYFKGVNITPVVEVFRSRVRLVERPFYIYHWGANADLVNSSEAQNDSGAAGVKYLKDSVGGYLGGLSQRGRSYLRMGPGLYMAADPTSTDDYGGGDPSSWNLLELKLPKGARVLDTNYDSSDFYQNIGLIYLKHLQLQKVLQSFQCPSDALFAYQNGEARSTREFLVNFLVMDYQPACAEFLKHVLSNVLKIDALAYSYSSSDFTTCSSSETRRIAFVMVGDAWLAKPDAKARLYTSRTKDNVDSRVIVESVFYELDDQYSRRSSRSRRGYTNGDLTLTGDQVTLLLQLAKERLKEKGITSPSFTVAKKKCKPDNANDCSVQLEYNDYRRNTQDSILISFKDLQMPEPEAEKVSPLKTISAKNPPAKSRSIHWNDLEGRTVHPNIQGWMQENIFNCGATSSLGLPGVGVSYSP